MRKFARVLALLLVAATSVMGLIQLPSEFRNDQGTLLQMSVAVGAALHAGLGVVTTAGMLLRKRWAMRAAIAWAIAVTYTASVASIAWETQRDVAVLFGGLMAGVSCALIGWWVWWAAREWSTHHIPSSSDSASPTQ